MTNVLDAAYVTGRDYPGGATALGHRLGRPFLRDELNPNRPPNLWLATAVDMMVASGDCRILYAMCAEVGHYPAVPMPEALLGGESPCLKQMSAVVQEASDVTQATVAALADGQVSDNERREVDRQCRELIAAVMGLMRAVEAKNAELQARAPGVAR